MRIVSLIALILLVPGCTVATWQRATTSELQHPTIVVPASQGPGDPQRLLAAYKVDGWEVFRVYFELPRDADGQIAAALRYRGSARTAAGIAADLTPQQRTAIQAYQLPDDAFVRFPPTLADNAAESPAHGLAIDQLNCVAIAVDEHGLMLPLTDKGLAAGKQVILLPNVQRRPKADQAADVTFAVAMTPLTVACDVVMLPIALPVGLFMLSRGDYCCH